MVKASRPAVKTLSIIKSRDIVVERLLKPCEDGNHSKCTGWAVIRKEVSPIEANYFIKCTCAHHHKKQKQKITRQQLQVRKKIKKRVKKKTKAKAKQKRIKKSKSKRSKRTKTKRR